jgi:predicted Zn-dependent protease
VLAFTRGQEEEADKYALDALKKMQISNDGITELFTKLKIIQSRYIQNIDKYSTTHPLSDSRIDFFTKYNTIKTKQTTKLQNLKLAHCLINGKINGFFDIKPSITADTSFLASKQCKQYYAIYRAIGKKNWDLAQDLADKYILSFPSQKTNPYFNETQGDISFAKSNLQDALQHYSAAIKNANKTNKPLFVTRQLLYKSFNTSIAIHKHAANLLLKDIAAINKELAAAKDQSYQAKLYFLLSVAKQYYGSEVLSLINLAFSKFYSGDKDGALAIYTKLSTNKMLTPEEKAELETLRILLDEKPILDKA